MRRVCELVFLFLVLCFGSVQAAVYSIDPAHSTVGFKVRHLVSQVPGTFSKFSGTIDYDPAAPGKGSVETSIETASIDTHNEKRDGHLRSADFLEVEKYPQMTFKSRRVRPAGKDKLEVLGDLTLHGVTKPATLFVDVSGMTKDPWGGTRTGFSAITQIKRSDYGIIWNKTLESGGMLLGDDVNISIEIEAVQQK